VRARRRQHLDGEEQRLDRRHVSSGMWPVRDDEQVRLEDRLRLQL
jgi:hypothetical protein